MPPRAALGEVRCSSPLTSTLGVAGGSPAAFSLPAVPVDVLRPLSKGHASLPPELRRWGGVRGYCVEGLRIPRT